MSELKVRRHIDEDTGIVFSFYGKSEADKVFAELEERHKMEVEQLLMEIVELKAQKAQAEDDCAYWKMREGNAVNAMHETEEACMFLTKSERHHKYKRCLAMAQEWRNYAAFCGMQSSCHNHRGFGRTAEKYTWKEIHAWKCVKRYKELAEKFKEA